MTTGRSVRVDDEVYAIIRQRIQSPADTHNRVLRRLLGMQNPPTPAPRTSPGTAAIQAALRAHPGATATELAHAAKVPYSSTTDILTALKNDGHAIRTGGGQQPGQRGRTSYTWWPTQPK
jgi:negative regulator of replication initiation